MFPERQFTRRLSLAASHVNEVFSDCLKELRVFFFCVPRDKKTRLEMTGKQQLDKPVLSCKLTDLRHFPDPRRLQVIKSCSLALFPYMHLFLLFNRKVIPQIPSAITPPTPPGDAHRTLIGRRAAPVKLSKFAPKQTF